jgi:Ser/Thr protein kinase RdoA (MazF antagonist)
MTMRDIIAQFKLDGLPISYTRYGSGHINETYLLVTNRPHLYILQKVNTQNFPDGEGLMRNVMRITEHIATKDPDPRHVLMLVPTQSGQKYLSLPGNELWRVYEFITDSICLDRAETADDFRQSGIAFGRFQQQLADFPADSLAEIIPGFHDTPRRYRAFKRAIEADALNRAKDIQPEIDFYLAREKDAGLLMNLLENGEINLRVAHNDTKLNNVMLAQDTHAPLCVIDLDTVMPGLAATDFGDSIRFGASTASEDEKDLRKVSLSLELYKAYTEGFLSVSRESLNQTELLTLPDGARLMTLECGVRFLTDYLQGDVYFHIARPEHNLDRTRTQMTLVADMERKHQEMLRIIREL